MNPGVRIPELGERVQMSKYATAFRGVWGRVVKIEFNPPPPRVLGRERVIQERIVPGASGGAEHTELYILAELPRFNGKRVMIKASPYELDGGVLDDRPILVKRS